MSSLPRAYQVENIVPSMRVEGMNHCIVSRLLDYVLLTRIDPKPCACIHLT